MKRIAGVFLFLIAMNAVAQNNNQMELPYYEVPEYYESYTAGTVTARMIDGLGFRFRWASEDLRTEDLSYKPSEEARTLEETVNHILGLSRIIVNSALKQPTDFTVEQPELTFEEKRKQILENLQKASAILQNAEDLSEFTIEFVSARGKRELPFWNQINGPIADAIWHCGQLVSMRRASGNPLNSKVSFLNGTVRE